MGVHQLFEKFLTGFGPFQTSIFENKWGTRPPSSPSGYATLALPI